MLRFRFSWRQFLGFGSMIDRQKYLVDKFLWLQTIRCVTVIISLVLGPKSLFLLIWRWSFLPSQSNMKCNNFSILSKLISDFVCILAIKLFCNSWSLSDISICLVCNPVKHVSGLGHEFVLPLISWTSHLRAKCCFYCTYLKLYWMMMSYFTRTI
jgi:hypothetical protein